MTYCKQIYRMYRVVVRIVGIQIYNSHGQMRKAPIPISEKSFPGRQGLGPSQPSSSSLNHPRPYSCIWFICLPLWHVDISTELQLQLTPGQPPGEADKEAFHVPTPIPLVSFLTQLGLTYGEKTHRDLWNPLNPVQTQPSLLLPCLGIICFFFSLMQAEHPSSDSLRSLALGINYTGDLKKKKISSRTLALGVNLHWTFVFKNNNQNF